MTHVRQQIRDAIVNRVTGLTTTGANVYGGRAQTVAKAKLPALFVFAVEEQSATDTMGPNAASSRRLTVEIQMAAHAAQGVDDLIDQVCLEVEQAMAGDVTLSDLAKDTELTGTTIEFDEDGDTPLATASLSYAVLYRVRNNDPETAI